MDDMVQHFSTQVAALKTSFEMRYVGGDKEDQSAVLQALSSLEANISQLENDLGACKLLLTTEKDQIEEMEKVKTIIDQQSARINFALENLPERRPQQCKAPVQSVAHTTNPITDGQENQPEPSVAVKPKTKKARRKKAVKVPTIPYIRVDEFESVPVYVRNRLKREVVNQCIDAIHVVLTKKYKILSMPRSTMGEQTMAKYKEFKEAECRDTDRQHFFLDCDLKQMTDFRMDSTGRACLAVLRTLGALQELRSGGYVRYILPQQ